MLVIIDEREIVTSGYACRFGSEGVSSAGFCPLEFQEWVATVADADLFAVEAFLLGDCRDRQLYPKMIKERTRAPVIAMNETPSLRADAGSICRRRRRRGAQTDPCSRNTGPRGSDQAPSRVRAPRPRWLATCVSFSMAEIRNSRACLCPCRGGSAEFSNIWSTNRGRRVSKAQIFNSIYGIFDENVEENVVESHISKLRKKLRRHLGYDPINSVRYLGYRLDEFLGWGLSRATATACQVNLRGRPAALANWLTKENCICSLRRFPRPQAHDRCRFFSDSKKLERVLIKNIEQLSRQMPSVFLFIIFFVHHIFFEAKKYSLRQIALLMALGPNANTWHGPSNWGQTCVRL